jgi:pyruvate kinase
VRHTKIVSTVGPASDSDSMLARLVDAGTDVFRLNFSHGTHESHTRTVARIRSVASRAGREIAILQDLSGPKIRTGRLEGGTPLSLNEGDRLFIGTGDEVGGPGRVFTTFAGLAKAVRPGDRLLLADGLIELRVEAVSGTNVETVVVEGGTLGEHKGINAPGVALAASAITAKDVEDLKFGQSVGIDLVGISFVQNADDLRQARELLVAEGSAEVPLVAKLERPQALENLDKILDSCQAVMIARGDLGLEIPLERVPRAQKEITRAARQRGIPVILATQVLESMTQEPRPTRAEVSDAAYAVDAGVDAIMLAGETAVGRYPVQAVQTLNAIVCDAESTSPAEAPGLKGTVDHSHALCEAAVTLANRGDAQAIVAITRQGTTARLLSALRPHAPIYATTDSDVTARRLAFCWGIVPIRTDIGDNVESAVPLIRRQLTERGFVAAGDIVVLVNIHPDPTRPDANYLKIHRL